MWVGGRGNGGIRDGESTTDVIINIIIMSISTTTISTIVDG